MAEQHESPPLEEKDETNVEINTDSSSVESSNVEPINSDPLLSQDVKERVHHFNPTTKPEIPEDEGNLDDLFGGGADDELMLEPPKIDTQGDEAPAKPDLDPMKVNPTGGNTLDPENTSTGVTSSASEFGWEIVQHTLPNMVHEMARMEKSDVNKILAKIGARCGEEEAEIIEEINTEFRNGLELTPAQNQMGKEAMRQLFVKKGIEKKITPEFMLFIAFVLILVSWGLAYKRFSRQKRDLFDRLEYLVKVQLKSQKGAEKQDDQAPSKNGQ